MPTDEDWKRAHQKGVRDLQRGYEDSGMSKRQARLRAEQTQERATNQARGEHGKK
jgi:hypothetical protein